MRQAAPDHFHHIRRTGDVSPKIGAIKFMNDAFQLSDWLLRIFAFLHEDNHIATLAILGDQQPAPERTRNRVLETLRASSQALDCAHAIDPLDPSSESFDPT